MGRQGDKREELLKVEEYAATHTTAYFACILNTVKILRKFLKAKESSRGIL